MKSRQPEIKKSDTYVHTDITVGGKAHFKKTLYVHERFNTQGTARIAGETSVLGSAIFKNSLSCAGEVSLDSKLCVKGVASFKSPIQVKSTAFTRHLAVEESAIFGGDAEIHKNLFVRGESNFFGHAKFVQMSSNEWLSTSGYLVVDSWANIDGALIVGGKGRFKSSVDFCDNVEVEGRVSALSDVSIEKNLKVKSHLKVSGESTLSGHAVCKKSIKVKEDAAVGGDGIFEGDIYCRHASTESISADKEIKGQSLEVETLSVEGESEIKGDLEVLGNVGLGGGLYVEKNLKALASSEFSDVSCGTLSVSENATVGGDLIVKKGIVAGEQAIGKKAHFDDLSIVNGPISSGVFLSSVTHGFNVEVFTEYDWQFIRVGDVVSASGRVDILPTQSGQVYFNLSLPVEAKFIASHELTGTAVSQDGSLNCACFADQISNSAKVLFDAKNEDRIAFFVNLMYRVRQ